MIHLCLDEPPDGAEAALEKLAMYQRDVDARPSYDEQVKAAGVQWESRRDTWGIHVVREMLQRMCADSMWCMYCEDSRPSDMEHFRPKNLYPSLVFAWMNFLYACTQCNRSKGPRFRAYRGDGTIVDLTRPRNAAVVPPEPGEPLLIDPRHEDPMILIGLDLTSGLFHARDERGIPFERATYTIGLLGLNKRDYLVRARMATFETNESLLKDYVERKRLGAPQDERDRKRWAIRGQNHRTVWEEMKRQRNSFLTLRALFEEAPEALTW